MANRTVVGIVTSTNARGFKLDVEGDEWLNWSRFSKTPESERPAMQRGQTVSVEIDDKGFVYRVSSPDGGALKAAPAGTTGYSGGSRSPEEAWRMTLLSCLRSASTIIQPMVSESGEVADKVGNMRASYEVTYQTALWMAKRVWAETAPPQPSPAGQD